ncbi:hypothetical protein [Winogradskyella poriferorum]|uniref:hypothetical protein n=1 Tax=Winogradskyella poriferorum TaxID=307627 RepID=UPI003D647ADB
MKTVIKNLQRITMCALLFVLLGCSEDDETNPGTGDGEIVELSGITEDELDNYRGDIGISIDVRGLIKKGYNPVKAILDFDATTGNYDRELAIDPFTNIVQYSLSVEDLSTDAEDELRNGVPLNVSILDENDSEIISESYSILTLEENGNDVHIDGNQLEYNNVELAFKLEMPHFLQTVDANGNYGTNAVEKPAGAVTTSTLLFEDYSEFKATWSNHQYYFYKYPNEENVFSIWSKQTNRYLQISNEQFTFRQNGSAIHPDGIQNNTLGDDYKFKIKREDNGLYTIRRYSTNEPLRRRPNGDGLLYWIAYPLEQYEIQYFRILALDVQWDFQELDTKFLNPILPSVDTSFGFNSTLLNCGNGNLSQEVGIEQEVTTSRTVGWEESISISSREEFGSSVTVGVEAEANFFGGTVTTNAEATASYNFSQEVTSSQSQFEEMGSEETNSYFSLRTVTVPSGSASLVYDAYQTYSNVKVPFVKRFRIFANQMDPANNNAYVGNLSGNEIATQFRVTNFRGTITEIGSDYIEVTLRGTTVLDNMVHTQSEIRDVAADCN